MANFIKFGLEIKDFLARKMGGFGDVKYKISHKELEELALQNEEIYKVLEELKVDKQKFTEIEIVSKVKSNYEIASIRLRNKANTLLNGSFSVSEENTGEVYKYHLATKDKLYHGYKTLNGEFPAVVPNKPVKYSDEEIIELYKQGISIEEIARRMWVSSPVIRAKIPPELNKYTTEGKDVLTQKIIEKYKSGMSSTDIAQELGIDVCTVNRKLPKELKEQRKAQIMQNLHDSIIKLSDKGLSPKEIAVKLKINTSTVYVHIKENKKQQGVEVVTTKEKVLNLFSQGLNPKEIATKLGIKLSNVYFHLPKEVKKGNTKLTAEVKNRILEMRKSGFSTKEIADELELSERTVNDFLPKEMKIQFKSIGDSLNDKIIEMRKEGYLLEEIASQLGISRGSVKKRLPEELRQKVVVPKEVKQKIYKMNDSGLKPEKIAQNLTIDLVSVKTVLKHPPKVKMSDLSESLKSEILEKRKSGMSVDEISREMGIKFLEVNKNLPPELREKRIITDETVAQIIKMRKEGKSNAEIAKETGVSLKSVINHIPDELRMAAKKLTEQQRKTIVEMRKNGFTSQEIADKLKINVGTVNVNLPEELKIGTKVSDEDINKIIQMRKSGLSPEEISEKTGYSYNTVYKYLPQELKSSTSKINDNVIKKIIQMRLSGMSTEEIARELNLARRTVYDNYPEELKNLRVNIETISEDDFKNAVLEGKTIKGTCEKLKIGISALNRLKEKYGVVSKRLSRDAFRESSTKKYEEFNNEDLKERFFNVAGGILSRISHESELYKTLDNISDEILSNDINFETRAKFIKLIRCLDLAERNIVTEFGLLKSPELKALKVWAEKSKMIEDLKNNLSYFINDLLPQKNEFELAEVLSDIKISGLDDPNVELLQKYTKKLINSENLQKDCLEILHLEIYRNASPELKLQAQKYSISELGKINPKLAGQYIRNLMVLRNPKKYKLPYPDKYIEIIRSEKLPENLSVRYMIKLENFFSETEPEKALLKDFCKMFDIEGHLDSKIIEEYILNTYNKIETKILAKGENMVEQEVTFCPKAKEGIIKQFGIPEGIKWITDFEDAMKIFISPDASRSGIKYMKNRGEYEVKLANESNRLLSSDKTLRFDIYKKDGLHTKKKK